LGAAFFYTTESDNGFVIMFEYTLLLYLQYIEPMSDKERILSNIFAWVKILVDKTWSDLNG
jgi:hypothetical protein